ncbi:ABC transporter substrate-binding protein [Tsukamurella soli]|uniref:ABC transporter substrate-binding protein n=1 Tax=Tsukamurella soli TaxID=644556 RepID=UPI003621542F
MKSPLRGLIAAVATVGIAASAAACGNAGSSAPTALTVGFVVDPSWAQIPVAVAGGDFQKHKIDVKVVDFSSGVEALQAVAAGQVDVTTAADVPVAATLTRSPSLRVVADGSRWNGSRVVGRRSAGITDVRSLAGKSIGTPLGTSADYYAANVLQQNNITAKLVQVAPSAAVTAASKRDVDAVAIFQPYQEQVVAALGSDAVQLAGSNYSQHSLYVATKDAVSRKAATLGVRSGTPARA